MSEQATGSTADPFVGLSDALAARTAALAPRLVALRAGRGRTRSAILWREGVLVASEQTLADAKEYDAVLPGGAEVTARLAGRDAGTNVAVLRIDGQDPAAPPHPPLPDAAEVPPVGSLSLVLGADGTGGPTARMAVVHLTGPEWHSMQGGRIDRLIRLDTRLGADEGGPVLDAAGRLIGMSTTGPRGRTLVIPAATVARVIDPLLAEGRIARGWLGAGLTPVMVPEALRESAGTEFGMMVVSLAPGAPAEQAGILPGDVVLALDGKLAARRRGLAELLGPETIGRTIPVRVMRAGALRTVQAVIAARPEK